MMLQIGGIDDWRFEMKTSHGMLLKAVAAATAVTALNAPALARDWHDNRGRYEHRDWDQYGDSDDWDVRLRGSGVNDLHPWFRKAKAGRQFAAKRAGASISEREARMLNREYYDRFGWREARGW